MKTFRANNRKLCEAAKAHASNDCLPNNKIFNALAYRINLACDVHTRRKRRFEFELIFTLA